MKNAHSAVCILKNLAASALLVAGASAAAHAEAPRQLTAGNHVVANSGWQHIIKGDSAGLWLDWNGAISIWTNGPGAVKVWESAAGGAGDTLNFNHGKLHLASNAFSSNTTTGERVVMSRCRLQVIDSAGNAAFSVGDKCPASAKVAAASAQTAQVKEFPFPKESQTSEAAVCYPASQPMVLLNSPKAQLKWESDGNLALYKRNVCADGSSQCLGAATFQSATSGRGTHLCFHRGEMSVHQIVSDARRVLWSTHTGWSSIQTESGKYVGVAGNTLSVSDTLGEAQKITFRPATHYEGFYITQRSARPETHAWTAHANPHFTDVSVAGPVEQTEQKIWYLAYQPNSNTHRIVNQIESHGQTYQRSLKVFDTLVHAASGDGSAFRILNANRIVLDGCTIKVLAGDGSNDVRYSAGACHTATIGAGVEYDKADGFGNNSFGAGYDFAVGYSTPNATTTRAYAEGSIFGRVFGNRVNIVAAEAEVSSQNGEHGSDARFEVMGVDIPIAISVEDKELLPPLEKTYFDQEKTFMAGPVPVRVSGTVTGTVGMRGSFQPGAAGGEVGVTPYVDLTASATAGVGVACANAGIRGTLSLIEVSAPITANLDLNEGTVSLGGDLTVESLSGSIELEANYCVGTESWELASWDAPASVTLSFADATLNY